MLAQFVHNLSKIDLRINERGIKRQHALVKCLGFLKSMLLVTKMSQKFESPDVGGVSYCVIEQRLFHLSQLSLLDTRFNLRKINALGRIALTGGELPNPCEQGATQQ